MSAFCRGRSCLGDLTWRCADELIASCPPERRVRFPTGRTGAPSAQRRCGVPPRAEPGRIGSAPEGRGGPRAMIVLKRALDWRAWRADSMVSSVTKDCASRLAPLTLSLLRLYSRLMRLARLGLRLRSARRGILRLREHELGSADDAGGRIEAEGVHDLLRPTGCSLARRKAHPQLRGRPVDSDLLDQRPQVVALPASEARELPDSMSAAIRRSISPTEEDPRRRLRKPPTDHALKDRPQIDLPHSSTRSWGRPGVRMLQPWADRPRFQPRVDQIA
jgi:hypothetical protein